MNAIRRYLLFLSRFSPRARVGMVLASDLVLCTFTVLLAYSLRIGEWRIFNPIVFTLVLITLCSWLTVAPLLGLYRSMLRFFGAHAIRDLAITCSVLSIPLIVFLAIIPINKHAPRTLSLLIPLILFLCLAGTRSVLSALLRESLYERRRTGRRHVSGHRARDHAHHWRQDW